MSSEAMPIDHDTAGRRFEAVVDGRTSFLSYAEAGDEVLDFRHTFVPPDLRGRGIASRIVEHALVYARAHGLKVIPTCPFVADFIRRHPAHRDVALEVRTGPSTSSVDKSVEKGDRAKA